MTLIKSRLGLDAICTPGDTSQFDVIVDGEKIATRGGNWITRKFGAGYPDLNALVDQLASRHPRQPVG